MSILPDWFSWKTGPEASNAYAFDLASRAKEYVRTECDIDLEEHLRTYDESIIGLAYLLCLCQFWANMSKIRFEVGVDELNGRFLDPTSLPPALRRQVRTDGRGFVTQEINASRSLVDRLVSTVDLAEEGRKGAVDWAIHYCTAQSPGSSAA